MISPTLTVSAGAGPAQAIAMRDDAEANETLHPCPPVIVAPASG